MSRQLFEPFSNLGFLLGLAWMLFFSFGSVIYRIQKRKQIFWPSFPNARYSDRWSSGHSRKNLLSKLGGARNCLWIAVTENELRVGPLFPFNMMFLPEIYDLEHCIKVSSIVDVKEESVWSIKSVVVTFDDGSGRNVGLVLIPKDIMRFRDALAEIRKPQTL